MCFSYCSLVSTKWSNAALEFGLAKSFSFNITDLGKKYDKQ